jgi:DNA-binding HxlR family transcriptional regulator
MPCSIARTLEVVGERWTMLVLREAFGGARRFEDFQRNLGVARNVLATRLAALVRHGILARVRYQERPRRFEYRLTEKGFDLYPIVVAMMRWGDRWLAGKDGPPLVLIHKACEHDITPALACGHCGEPIGARDIRAIVGPGLMTLGKRPAKRPSR